MWKMIYRGMIEDVQSTWDQPSFFFHPSSFSFLFFEHFVINLMPTNAMYSEY